MTVNKLKDSQTGQTFSGLSGTSKQALNRKTRLIGKCCDQAVSEARAAGIHCMNALTQTNTDHCLLLRAQSMQAHSRAK